MKFHHKLRQAKRLRDQPDLNYARAQGWEPRANNLVRFSIFRRAEIECRQIDRDLWAPPWAHTVCDVNGLTIPAREALLRRLKGQAETIAAMDAAIRLGGLEAIFDFLPEAIR